MTEGLGDHYEVLGVSRTATYDEIRAAYRKLAAQYHPDRNPGPLAARLMARINLAYEVLSDDWKRDAYNPSRSRRAASSGASARPNDPPPHYKAGSYAREQYQRYRERRAQEEQRAREQQERAQRAYEKAFASADAHPAPTERHQVSIEEHEEGTKFVVALSLLMGMISCAFGGPVIGILVAVFGPAILTALAYAGPTLGRLVGVLLVLLVGLVAFAALVLYVLLNL